MRHLRSSLVLLLLAAGVLGTARLSVRAQERTAQRSDGLAAGAGPISVQDALQRPFSFPFAAPTALSDVCQYLRETLKAPVVLDRAAFLAKAGTTGKP